MKNDKKPELLAPAGNLTCALAAFDAGADAVYAGLPRFNARERSENFTTEDYSKLIAYARKNGKKVYLTLNTLIKEIELKDLIELLSEVAYMRPDAVIVQDLGVLYAIKNYFPSLTIHASTQMGIHNSAGIELLEKLGVERVILERQVTITEIEEIMSKTKMEVEVFVHGALCCSLSGSCTFSSWLGGWSGNRGKCKQPCRRRFFSESGNGFFFSPQDLYTLDFVEKFKELGIASMKIEGRLKKPDYIRHTVKSYKMLVDCDDISETVLKEARRELSYASGRKWSHGFYTEESQQNLIHYKQLGVAGSLSGDIIDTEGNIFAVEVTKRLHVGDRIRIQPRSGEDGPAMTITKLFVNNKSVTKATKGQICTIPFDRPVEVRSQVFKIGVSTESMESRIANLPGLKPELDFKIELYNNLLKIEVLEQGLVWEKKVAFSAAKSRSCDEATVRVGLKPTGDSQFTMGKTDITVAPNLFVPGSELKILRKEFWAWLNNSLTLDQVKAGQTGLFKFFEDYKDIIARSEQEVNPWDTSFKRQPDVYGVKPESHLPPKKVDYCRSIYSFDKKTAEVSLPHFCPENHLESLRKHVDRAYKAGVRRFRVTSLFNLALLDGYDDIEICTSHPLPITNSLATRCLADLGVSKAQAWVELDKDSIGRLVDGSVIRIEMYRYGRIPLLETRAKVSTTGRIKDNRGNKFVVMHDRMTKLTNIFSNEILKIERVNNTDNYYDLTNASWGSSETSSFNYESDFV